MSIAGRAPRRIHPDASNQQPGLVPVRSNHIQDPISFSQDDVSGISPDPDEPTLRAFLATCVSGPFGLLGAYYMYASAGRTGYLAGAAAFAFWASCACIICGGVFLSIQALKVPCSEAQLTRCRAADTFPCACFVDVHAAAIPLLAVGSALGVVFGILFVLARGRIKDLNGTAGDGYLC